MIISTYHVHNVLKAYGKQLSRKSRLRRTKGVVKAESPGRAIFSTKTRQKAVIDRLISDIINGLIKKGPHGGMEKKAVKQVEDEHGNSPSVKKEYTELVFKAIDKEKGEVTKTLSINDSKFLKDRLQQKTANRKVNE